MVFDLAVIGSGIGGYSGAIRASERGLKVILIDQEKTLGGTCLKRGCIPTKLLLKRALFAKEAKLKGWETKVDLAELIQEKDLAVQKISSSLMHLLQSHGIEILCGRTEFISPTQLSVDGKTIEAKKILIATGSEPLSLKNLPADNVFDSTSILNLKTLPKSLAIIGGGYIGSEFATLFQALGTKVYLIEAEERLLPHMDIDLSSALKRSFQKQGIEVLTSAPLQKGEKTANGLKLFLPNQMLEVDCVLVAIGRKLNSGHLKLEKIHLPIEANGAIATNEHMQTKVENIYAAGDITGKMLLAHLAAHQGIVAAENIANHPTLISYKAVPSVVFSSPEIASVGLTLEGALKQKLKAKSVTYPFSALGLAMATQETEGFVKLVYLEKEETILGAHLFGEGSSALISEMALSISTELTLEDLAHTIHPHPTKSEILSEAVFLAKGLPLHFPPLKSPFKKP